MFGAEVGIQGKCLPTEGQGLDILPHAGLKAGAPGSATHLTGHCSNTNLLTIFHMDRSGLQFPVSAHRMSYIPLPAVLDSFVICFEMSN